MNTPAPFRTPSPGDKPIIAVCGATGFQGGSVVNHLLRDGRFAVRALTRKPTSFRAKELVRAGATVVEADFGNITSLRNAFEGCYGAFGLTDYFDAFEEEAQHGRNIIDAAQNAKLKHLVMSTVPPIDSIKDVNLCKYKHQTRTHLTKSGVPFTAFTASFYYNDIFLFDMLIKGANGNWVMNFPFPYDIPIPCMASKDIGAYILAIFLNPSEWMGKDLWACNELLSLRQLVETFTEVTGFDVVVYQSTKEKFLALKDEPFLLGMWEIFDLFIQNYDHNYRYVSPALARSLYSQQQTWKDFLVEYRETPIPQPVAIECFHTRERFGDS
ncbi:NmrA-like family domain-containing protein 1 [Gallus gallus] [Rhizoctonia solani]|uniref:NmrA-like family domain-containing protein 1 [Gallus gallus] n=1 Tax=Rhizoctonia solani TaxID=456999 RepID=A0A0K6G4J1_9AGAM|nr:NmrA-like family domain-containing protein 1 [Gallus gallus] [Rhizoctonia solani]